MLLTFTHSRLRVPHAKVVHVEVVNTRGVLKGHVLQSVRLKTRVAARAVEVGTVRAFHCTVDRGGAIREAHDRCVCV